MSLPSLQSIDLSPGDLLYYGGVEWLNISDFLGKIKKGLELHAMCFVFKTAVVFLCKERLRQKKKSIMPVSVREYVQPADIGWPTGNGKKLSCTQACCLAQLCLGAP